MSINRHNIINDSLFTVLCLVYIVINVYSLQSYTTTFPDIQLQEVNSVKTELMQHYLKNVFIK